MSFCQQFPLIAKCHYALYHSDECRGHQQICFGLFFGQLVLSILLAFVIGGTIQFIQRKRGWTSAMTFGRMTFIRMTSTELH